MESNWAKHSAEQASRHTAHEVPITINMLMGTGTPGALQAHLVNPT